MSDAAHVEQEIWALEERLLARGGLGSERELAALLADDFVEFGASGRRWDKRGALAAIASAGVARARALDFRVRSLGERAVLATYQVERAGDDGTPARRSLRSSIWERGPAGWRLVFHQGTPTGASSE